MSDDKSDKAGGWFANPLPIVMVVLLAAGVLVKNIPLESARPTDPERVKFVPTGQQDVEARLWQDPFAAVEKHERNSNQSVTPTERILKPSTPSISKTQAAPHTPEMLHPRIQALHEKSHTMTVVAVSVMGGSYAEAAESRRRSRFAVISALGFHHYHPENSDALGYVHIDPPESQSTPNPFNLTVPYEWFETRSKSSTVLVLWLNEDKLTSDPLTALHILFDKLTPNELAGSGKGLTVKFIGPAGSGVLAKLISGQQMPQQKSPTGKEHLSTIEVFSPSATVSNCDLKASGTLEDPSPWNCFMMDHSTQPTDQRTLPIVRTTGTDDVLVAALLWELWQRGVNRTQVDKHQCADGLVLIGERDTEYGRTLSRYLKDGFSERCGGAASSQVRTFNYLRGLDGVLPDIDKSGGKAPPKDDSSRSNDLRAQLDDTPPEHAEGRSQFDYLRRLADEIDRLDHDKKFFAENGVKAIGLVGSDLYDKLLILQALRSRFKDKIFFTTDLDARYLHADQKDWARNLVIASNFGLSLRPALQHSTLPFRDSYQTATYLATLMALDNKPFSHWPSKMKDWLGPQIFEIGRTEAVHLASPSVDRLKNWVGRGYAEGRVSPATATTCDRGWEECQNIEPDWPSRNLSLEHLPEMLIMFCLGILLVTLASRSLQETIRTACGVPSPTRDTARTILYVVIGTMVTLFIILAIVWILLDDSLKQDVGEPFVWLEGISVWPSLMVRFVGFVTMLALWYILQKSLRRQERRISEDFQIATPHIRTLNRGRCAAAFIGPYLDITSSEMEGLEKATSTVKKERDEEQCEVAMLWQNYLRVTSAREMAGWIMVSMLIGGLLGYVAFQIFGGPSFPHRGELALWLHRILIFINVPTLWLVIFWVGYETRACARFIQTLSGVPNRWPDQLLAHKEKEAGVPRAHLDDYLDFQLVVRATQRIRWLIYLPFVSILFMVLARSHFFDAMDFPFALLLVIGLALAYALHSARLLRQSAEKMRATALNNYETLRSSQTWPPINGKEIDLLMERIRNTREGAFAPFAQQPALQALLLPFGGYGSVQIIEYLFKL